MNAGGRLRRDLAIAMIAALVVVLLAAKAARGAPAVLEPGLDSQGHAGKLDQRAYRVR